MIKYIFSCLQFYCIFCGFYYAYNSNPGYILFVCLLLAFSVVVVLGKIAILATILGTKGPVISGYSSVALLQLSKKTFTQSLASTELVKRSLELCVCYFSFSNFGLQLMPSIYVGFIIFNLFITIIMLAEANRVVKLQKYCSDTLGLIDGPDNFTNS
jgi:hypothetical protein